MELFTETTDSKGYIGSPQAIVTFAKTLGDELEQTFVTATKTWLGVTTDYQRPTIIKVKKAGVWVADMLRNEHGQPFYIIVNKDVDWATR